MHHASDLPAKQTPLEQNYGRFCCLFLRPTLFELGSRRLGAASRPEPGVHVVVELESVHMYNSALDSILGCAMYSFLFTVKLFGIFLPTLPSSLYLEGRP